MIRCIILRVLATNYHRRYSTEALKYVKIGNVRASIRKPKSPHLVPVGFGVNEANSSVLSHLKWLLQKDSLKQDVFLIGVPGALRSHIVLQYLELCGREFEYLSITRDTTEADIKQRREIRNGTAFYTDLCAVRAALNGRVLVIDGVEKAERNVLPILNSLLESREMQLDDGRFLIPAHKYDALVQEMGEEAIREKKLERVSEDFLVIALGLPVPPFKGHSLDPPLRSRFQCRHIGSVPFGTLHELCCAAAPEISSDRISSLISLCLALTSSEAITLSLPRFPIDNLLKLARIWNLNPSRSAEDIFKMGYPYETVLRSGTQIPVIKEFLKKFSIKDERPNPVTVTMEEHSAANDNVTVKWGREQLSFRAPRGTRGEEPKGPLWKPYVSNREHDRLLAEMAMSHAVGDFCVLGPKGCGKTTVVEQFAHRMGYLVSTMTLYQDMNSRELLQERRMLPNGDTVWEDSVLVDCAKKGRLCILDGIERIHWSALEVLAPLIHHRQIDLFDGSRLLDSERFHLVAKSAGLSKEQLEKKGVFEIHPSFRIIAVGDSENESRWLNEQVLSLFTFHTMKALSVDAQCRVIGSLVPNEDATQTRNVVTFVESLRNSPDAGLRGVAQSLSLRKLVHLVQRSAAHHDEDICSGISRAALSRFLPVLTHNSFEKALQAANIARAKTASVSSPSPSEGGAQSNIVRIGSSVVRRNETSDRTMVPDVLFYDNAQHIAVMSDMARDMELGSHLLLIGNQGVGKNKVTDRFLHLINRPRQYLQLHRDTTVQSLTVHSTVVDGRLILEDSPLVRAAREGNVLVVDEADKAPLHVVAVLKSLLDIGVMRLADGRIIEPTDTSRGDRSIPLHPDFRIIMLANRPGFPFLGNDLFSILGDLFSVHIVDNPSRESELNMLKQYAPNVDNDILTKLCAVFDELRSMADDALLPYPYSTRELVNIAKHLEKYPADGITLAVRNVFDFDDYSRDTLETVEKILHKHGIPFGVDRPYEKVYLAISQAIPPMSCIGEWAIRNNVVPDNLPIKRFPLQADYSGRLSITEVPLQREHMRSTYFSEQEHFSQIEIGEVNICSAVASSGKTIAIAGLNPPSIYVLDSADSTSAKEIDVSFIFPAVRGYYRPRITLRFLSDSRLLLHEEMSNILLEVDLGSGRLSKLPLDATSVVSSVVSKMSPFTVSVSEKFWRFNPDSLVFFERKGRKIKLIDGDAKFVANVALPEGKSIENILSVNPSKHLLELHNEYALLSLEEDGRCLLRAVDASSHLPRRLLCSRSVKSTSNTDLHIIASDQYYAVTSNGFPMTFSAGEVNVSKREDGTFLRDVPHNNLAEYAHPCTNSFVMDNGLIVRAMPLWRTPKKALHEDIPAANFAGFLEVVDPASESVRYIPVPCARQRNFFPSWIATVAPAGFSIAQHGDDSILTCDITGGLRKWQITQDSIASAFGAWKKMFADQSESLRLEYEKDDFDINKLGDPKIGKFDPDNTPHVGGSTWAGGTGGYNTAGLGGVGGPFRLDAGHNVHQLPQSAKDAVPEHILKKAREIAMSEYKKRLHAIEMSEHDAKTYNELYARIEKQSRTLRTVIDSLEAKEKERQWVRHQTTGDLDDAKLVEGVTGEKTIYRRRIDKEPDPGTEQKKPKRIRFCFDVSGSMYRFNGYDHRLQRSLETALLVMESLHGKQSKIRYDIIGHSGESEEAPFVKVDRSPANENSRLKVLKKMVLHSQFCMSGDSTLESMKLSIREVAKEDADERFVVSVSDANFDRYGIRPSEIIRCMDSGENVNVFLILIGSLGQQAERLQAALPPGRVFVCADTTQMPQIMQNIFSSALLK
uniref:VWFA domain-containing protein n=1 Tax=Ascaris suum TaxID=6253 RepID=F1KQG7_ASCSU